MSALHQHCDIITVTSSLWHHHCYTITVTSAQFLVMSEMSEKPLDDQVIRDQLSCHVIGWKLNSNEEFLSSVCINKDNLTEFQFFTKMTQINTNTGYFLIVNQNNIKKIQSEETKVKCNKYRFPKLERFVCFRKGGGALWKKKNREQSVWSVRPPPPHQVKNAAPCLKKLELQQHDNRNRYSRFTLQSTWHRNTTKTTTPIVFTSM